MGAMQAYRYREDIARVVQHYAHRPANMVDYVLQSIMMSQPFFIKEALTVLPPAYALLYFLGYVGHAQQTMPLAK